LEQIALFVQGHVAAKGKQGVSMTELRQGKTLQVSCANVWFIAIVVNPPLFGGGCASIWRQMRLCLEADFCSEADLEADFIF
jgi:hypothetical protein